MKTNSILKANIFNIAVSLIAIACGICIISYKPTFLVIVAAAAVIYGVLQIIKFLRALKDTKSLIELIVGVFLIITGVFMAISPEMAIKALLFVELALGVCGLVMGAIWLLHCFKEKQVTPNAVFIIKLCFCAAILVSGIILIVFSYLGGDVMKINDRILVGAILVLYGMNSLLWLLTKSIKSTQSSLEATDTNVRQTEISSVPPLATPITETNTVTQKETADASVQ